MSIFVPLDETQARGIEFIANQYGMFLPALDVRFNVAYMKAEIEKNTSKPECNSHWSSTNGSIFFDGV